jgi:hypothetical protein
MFKIAVKGDEFTFMFNGQCGQVRVGGEVLPSKRFARTKYSFTDIIQ